MIYDITIFFNENHLFDLRYQELKDKIDKFIIVESFLSFSGNLKGINFDIYKYYKNNKVNYYFLEGSILKEFNKNEQFQERFREKYQRNYIQKVVNFLDSDCIFCSDVDEIIHRDNIDKIVELVKIHDFVSITLPCYYYYLNAFRCFWTASFAISGKFAKLNSFNNYRWKAAGVQGLPELDFIPEPYNFKARGGHFSFLNDATNISLKIKSIAETYFNREEFTNIDNINNHISNLTDFLELNNKESFKIVEIGDTHPKAILENYDYWKSYIREK